MTLTFNDEQAAKLLDALGLDADVTDAETVLAAAEDLAAREAGINAEKPSTVAAAARKAGLEVVDAPTLASLRHDAAEGRKLAAAAARQKIETTVDDAVGKGKITAARKKHWITLIEADPGMAEVLAAVPAETAVPMTELGHSVEPVDADTRDEPVWFYDRPRRRSS